MAFLVFFFLIIINGFEGCLGKEKKKLGSSRSQTPPEAMSRAEGAESLGRVGKWWWWEGG